MIVGKNEGTGQWSPPQDDAGSLEAIIVHLKHYTLTWDDKIGGIWSNLRGTRYSLRVHLPERSHKILFVWSE